MKTHAFTSFAVVRKIGLVASLSILCSCLAGNLSAQTFSYYENLASFGLMDQNNPLVTPTAVGPTACAPTSIANSLVFLNNTYNVPNCSKVRPKSRPTPR
jgi:hypothetical protein